MTKLALTIGIAAVAAAFQVANAAEFGRPYEQLDIDLAVPNIADPAPAGESKYGAPFEDVQLDRALPQFPERTPRAPFTRGAPHEDLTTDRMLPNVPERPGAGADAPFDWDKHQRYGD